MNGRLRRGAAVATLQGGTEDEPLLYVGAMPSGDIVMLSGSALVIWEAILELCDEDLVIEQLAADYEVPSEEMRASVTGFVQGLVEQSLLERHP